MNPPGRSRFSPNPGERISTSRKKIPRGAKRGYGNLLPLIPHRGPSLGPEGSRYILFSLTIIFLNIDTIGNLLVRGIKIP
jgi:hypothetical protein